MNEYNFLPLWYRKRVKEKSYLRFKINLVILLLCITIIGIDIIINSKNIISINKEVEQSIQNVKVERNRLYVMRKKKISTINTLKNFIVYLGDKKNFFYVKIKDKKIQLDGSYSDKQKISEFIEYIEKSKKIKILDLESVTENNNIRLKISLEVNND
ncbi:hypothetical protein [Clostridium ganghwense]|uniref:Fimbrial assembly protein n=1 Tax=Clostridium ganghwense TaxID=312089 RepID=A0ABT4CMP1_9CLOT|nr:hypothetical protein [Clostridium ganghwense]MCY6370328.1 hypothetical protein [Clostridium ganghwense]